MTKAVIITGSPTYPSRSSSVALEVGKKLSQRGVEISTIETRGIPAIDLIIELFIIHDITRGWPVASKRR
jgi:NAD(P)H-dependent FMN reductase